MYLHGGLIGGPWAPQPGIFGNHCFGYVPGRTRRLTDVKEWLAALDEWRRDELAAWAVAPQWSTAYAESDKRGQPPVWPADAAARGGQALGLVGVGSS